MPDHQKLVDAFRQAMFVDRDPAAIARLYTEDAVLTDPNIREPLRGREAIAAYHGTFLRAFPDLSAETRNVFGAGEWFAAEFRVTGTHTGPLEGEAGSTIPPTGKEMSLDVCWIGRATGEGLCAEDRSYYDNGVFIRLAEPALK